MPKVHCVGGHGSDQITDFSRVVRTALCGVVMSLEQLRRYCGSARTLALRDWSILLAALMLPLAPLGASAQIVPASKAAWIGEAGTASFYGNRHQGRRTASGVRFDQRKLTAAHPWLPFGTKVRVTALDTGRSVIVTITDRLHSTRRVIDLSTAAARILGMMRIGVTEVSLIPG
jgi:rare lipoprotein A